MKKLVDLVKIQRLDFLIRHEATGNPNNLAKKLEISRRSLFNLFDFLKVELNAPISYNKSRESYVYDYLTKFHLGFEKNDETINVNRNDNEKGQKIINGNKKKKQSTQMDDNFTLDDDIDFNDLYL